MKIRDIKNGEIYYTIDPDDESKSYGELKPHKPFPHKAEVVTYYNDRERKTISSVVIYLRAVDENGVPDDDTNATVTFSALHPRGMEKDVDVFDDEAAAWRGYVKAMLEYAAGLTRDALDTLHEIHEMDPFRIAQGIVMTSEAERINRHLAETFTGEHLGAEKHEQQSGG
jgi:hypothetical protein